MMLSINKQKIFKVFVLTLLLVVSISGFSLTSNADSTVYNDPNNQQVQSAPDVRTHSVTKILKSSGPSSFIFNDTIDGVWYIGTLYKVQEQYNPEIGYLTMYSGTVYKK